MLGLVFGLFIVLLFLGLPMAIAMIIPCLVPSMVTVGFPGTVNYVLRAIQVKEGGKHSVVLKFDPQTVHNTETLANVALVITFLLFALALAWPFVFKKK